MWLNLSNIKEKDKSFLLDTLLSPPGLFGVSVNSVVERFQRLKCRRRHTSSISLIIQRSQELLGGSRPQPEDWGNLKA